MYHLLLNSFESSNFKLKLVDDDRFVVVGWWPTNLLLLARNEGGERATQTVY